MNFFKPFALKWWQGGLFKIAMVSLGIAIGATWPDLFSGWRPALLIVFVLFSIYLFWIWLKQ